MCCGYVDCRRFTTELALLLACLGHWPHVRTYRTHVVVRTYVAPTFPIYTDLQLLADVQMTQTNICTEVVVVVSMASGLCDLLDD